MKLANTLFATVAIFALAGPAFAQANPTLLTTASNSQSAVTTSIAPACALSTQLSTFNVVMNANGGVTTDAADQNVTVTCNTPDGNVTIGSDDMFNVNAPAIVEAATFTNFIRFAGQADGAMGGDAWQIDSRLENPVVSSATVGFNTTRRIRNLVVSIENVAPLENKLPVAGAYLGAICLTVSPIGALTGTGGSNTREKCGSRNVS